MVRIDARTHWNWVFQNQQVVIDVIRNSRAASAVADVPHGHRPSGRCDHDCVVLDGVASAEPIKLLVVRSHASAPTHSDGTGNRSSLARMEAVDAVQTKGVGRALRSSR